MSAFPKKTKEEPKTPETFVEGAFMCQECEEVVMKAWHDRKTQKLSWTCPNGHESSINFRM